MLFCSSKITCEQRYKPFQSFFLICSVCNQIDLCIFCNAKGKNTEKTLCIYSAFIFFDPDIRTIFIRFLNKKCSRSCMQSNGICYGNRFAYHKNSSFVFDFLQLYYTISTIKSQRTISIKMQEYIDKIVTYITKTSRFKQFYPLIFFLKSSGIQNVFEQKMIS